MSISTFNATAQAARAGEAAARRAGVHVAEVEDMPEVRDIVRLLEAVWGRNEDGVPFPAEVLRSIVHAGGALTVARDVSSGDLVGAAVLGVAPEDTTYSYVAASARGLSDRGIGYAVKLRQRAWALERGRGVMRWTFDPLVSRNARFNLVKLGARAETYIPSFYGRMLDRLNGGDDSDRLVAEWVLDGPMAVAATEGTAPEPGGPSEGSAVVDLGPDGEPAHRALNGVQWIRVPQDIVALRRADPAAAHAWRLIVRRAFTEALGAGLQADAVTRDGWYRLVRDGQIPPPDQPIPADREDLAP